jgi:succinyl-diaminopimelate desuccinylase
MELAGDVIFAGTAGEEVDCAGSRRLVSQGVGLVGELVVGEPTRLDVAPAHKGALWVEIETAGKAAHGSMPEQGSNAILFMRDVINGLDGFRADVPAHPLLGRATVNIGAICGGTKPNIVPDACTLTVDLRTLPGESHTDILEQLRSRLGEVTVRVLNSMPAVETPADAPLIESAPDITRNLRNPKLRGMTYFSDASVLAAALAVPTLILGPGDERLAHQANEHIAVEEVITAAQLYFELAQRRLQ